MNPWDEEAYREINDLDAARLAIRGALATIRDLQDLNATIKGNLQESASKEKLNLQQISQLTKQLENWQEQGKIWEAERQERPVTWIVERTLRERFLPATRTKKGKARV